MSEDKPGSKAGAVIGTAVMATGALIVIALALAFTYRAVLWILNL